MLSNRPALIERYRRALLDDVVPFWEKHSIDRECGGYLTCLERDGTVFDTDKFIWFQARSAWMFSALYLEVEKRPEWLELARHGIAFLEKYGRDAAGDWYFSLDRSGAPLVQPYNIFSDCFAAMAFGKYALAEGDDAARTIALDTFHRILARRDAPKGKYDKTVAGTRSMRNLALPMMLAVIGLELDELLPPETRDRFLDEVIEQIFGLFLDEKSLLLYENVGLLGEKLDCFEGRLIVPGHGIEAMWFLMEAAERRGDGALIARCKDIALRLLRFGWDDECGGIFYFLDAHGHPTQQLEWDRKLWWVHAETLIALLMGARLTGDPRCAEWFEKVHDYTWRHFPDPEYGEWFGYLDRRGAPFLTLKGGKWKGFFHVPRCLMRCWRELEKMEARDSGTNPGGRG